MPARQRYAPEIRENSIRTLEYGPGGWYATKAAFLVEVRQRIDAGELPLMCRVNGTWSLVGQRTPDFDSWDGVMLDVSTRAAEEPT